MSNTSSSLADFVQGLDCKVAPEEVELCSNKPDFSLRAEYFVGKGIRSATGESRRIQIDWAEEKRAKLFVAVLRILPNLKLIRVDFPRPTNLDTYRFSHCSLDIITQLLKHSRRIECLDLISPIPFTFDPIFLSNFLDNFQSLKSLRLTGIDKDCSKKLSNTLSSLPNLKSLQLLDCEFMDDLFSTSWTSKLEVLYFDCCTIQNSQLDKFKLFLSQFEQSLLRLSLDFQFLDHPFRPFSTTPTLTLAKLSRLSYIGPLKYLLQFNNSPLEIVEATFPGTIDKDIVIEFVRQHPKLKEMEFICRDILCFTPHVQSQLNLHFRSIQRELAWRVSFIKLDYFTELN